MEYVGAEHYYFWKGIETAQIDQDWKIYKPRQIVGYTTKKLLQNCFDAFIWGYYLGKSMSKIEYLNTVKINQNVTFKAKKDKKIQKKTKVIRKPADELIKDKVWN